MGTEKKTDVEKAGYKGQVKSVKVTAFKIEEKDGKQVLTQVRSKYDEKGNETETIRYDASGKIKGKTTYKYDEKGNRVEINYPKNSFGLTKMTFKYDDKGRTAEQVNYQNGNIRRKFVSRYDEKGNETETISYDANGKIEYKIKYIYKYGEKGNLISRTTSGPRKPRWEPDEQIWEFTYWD